MIDLKFKIIEKKTGKPFNIKKFCEQINQPLTAWDLYDLTISEDGDLIIINNANHAIYLNTELYTICKESHINIKEVLEKDPFIYIAVINDKINNVRKVVGAFSTEKLARASLKKYAHYDTQVIKKALI